VAHGVHADRRAFAGRRREVARGGAASAPVAHINLVSGQEDIGGGDTGVPRAQAFARCGVQLMEAVAQVAGDIQAAAVGREGQTGGQLVVLPGDSRVGDGQHARLAGAAPLIQRKHPDVSAGVRQIEAPAIGREHQAGETHLGGQSLGASAGGRGLAVGQGVGS